MISTAQAEAFLVNILGYTNWKEILEKDRLEFLRTLVPYYSHHLYFHNICMSSIPPDERRVPNEDDIIAAGLSGNAGVCITQNAFLAILLRALGFNSYIISGNVRGPVDSHVACAVEFSPNEKYFLELGFGLPFAEPVPIHSLPFTRTAGGFRYRYQKAGDGREGVYCRVQLDGALFGEEYEDKTTEFVRYEFTMEPRTIDYFQKRLEDVFTDIDSSLFLQHPFMFRYFEEDQDGNMVDQPNLTGDRKWILIRGVSVLIGTDNTRKVTHYSTYDQVKDVILKYFPRLRNLDFEKSYKYFNATVPKYGYFRTGTN